MNKKTKAVAIELSETAADVLNMTRFKSGATLFDSAVIARREPSQSTNELLKILSVDFSHERTEAAALLQRLRDDSGVADWRRYVVENPPSADVLLFLLIAHQRDIGLAAKKLTSSKAKKSAFAGHSKPGRSHEKQKNIRDAWASGKYSSREVCAEQECAALGMSFSAARRALRNIPQPT